MTYEKELNLLKSEYENRKRAVEEEYDPYSFYIDENAMRRLLDKYTFDWRQ